MKFFTANYNFNLFAFLSFNCNIIDEITEMHSLCILPNAYF